jgi:lambda repressor-like predicted transcriptional regulator
LAELIARARRVADTEALMTERKELVAELRRRGFSWRQLQQETGFPHSSARRWLKRKQSE